MKPFAGVRSEKRSLGMAAPGAKRTKPHRLNPAYDVVRPIHCAAILMLFSRMKVIVAPQGPSKRSAHRKWGLEQTLGRFRAGRADHVDEGA
jgi:hypothetical protein